MYIYIYPCLIKLNQNSRLWSMEEGNRYLCDLRGTLPTSSKLISFSSIVLVSKGQEETNFDYSTIEPAFTPFLQISCSRCCAQRILMPTKHLYRLESRSVPPRSFAAIARVRTPLPEHLPAEVIQGTIPDAASASRSHSPVTLSIRGWSRALGNSSSRNHAGATGRRIKWLRATLACTPVQVIATDWPALSTISGPNFVALLSNGARAVFDRGAVFLPVPRTMTSEHMSNGRVPLCRIETRY